MFGLAALLPRPAFAQMTPAPAPVASLPSRSQIEQPAPPAEDRSTASVTRQRLVRASSCPLAGSTLKVAITDVEYRAAGHDTLPPPIAALLAALPPPPKGDQPLSVVCTLRDAADAALSRVGYVASVQVPPQEITDHKLRFSVVLARIVEVRIHGDPGHYRGLLTRVIDRLRALDPLNERDAERLLLLAGDVPGLEVQLSLRPAGTMPGDIIGDLSVVTHRVSIVTNAQNYGSRSLGRETGYARVDVNALFLPGDTLYLGGSFTAQLREQRIAQAGYRLVLDDSGLTIGSRIVYAWSRPDIGKLDLRSRSLIAGLEITQPIVRSVRDNLSAAIGFEAVEQKVRVYDTAGSSPLNLDRLRVPYVRLDGQMSRRRGDGLETFSLRGSAEVRKGLGILGATWRGQLTSGYSPSRPQGDPQAVVVRGELTALARLNRTLSFAHTIIGQWADHPLLNFEEQALGNLTLGLGYDPGANSADRFVGIHSEARVDFNVAKAGGVQLFGFGDNVWIWNLDDFSTETDRHLGSVGGGVRARLPGPVLLEVTYARPLDRALTIDKARATDRVLISLTTQLQPKFR